MNFQHWLIFRDEALSMEKKLYRLFFVTCLLSSPVLQCQSGNTRQNCVTEYWLKATRSIRKDFYQKNTSAALNKTRKRELHLCTFLLFITQLPITFARDISTANVASREIYFKKKKKKKRTRAFDRKKDFSVEIYISDSLDLTRSIDLTT